MTSVDISYDSSHSRIVGVLYMRSDGAPVAGHRGGGTQRWRCRRDLARLLAPPGPVRGGRRRGPPPDKLLARPAQGADPILVLAIGPCYLVGHAILFDNNLGNDAGIPFPLPQRLDLGTRCELRDRRRRDAEAL